MSVPPTTRLEPCDVVMKGGITSGVVYPTAVHTLSQAYQFKNIGGTSAGAIAAAAAAAAECGRQRGRNESFATLARMPRWLGEQSTRERTNLAGLFQPQAATKKVFDTLFAAVGDPKLSTARQRALRVAARAPTKSWAWAALGCSPALIPLALIVAQLALSWDLTTALLLIPAAIIVGLFAVAGLVLGAIGGLGRALLVRLPENYLGLCTGGGPEPPEGPQSALERMPTLPLNHWLSELLDELAGLSDAEKPLTFRHLWASDSPPQPGTSAEDPAVTLSMITTDVSAGTPYRLPLDVEAFWVRREDLAAFFQEVVVKQIVDKSPTQMSAFNADVQRRDLFLKLPAAEDIPVVFATRLSLSFPGLLSAFPLYEMDEKQEIATRHWFSDGGISSNFPMHFFDAPLPRWPTFGINLFSLGPGRSTTDDECENVGVGGWDPPIRRVNDVFSFIGAIKDSMQNWRDNALLGIPGYRERIAHIGFHRGEGGLNLYMGKEEVRKLGERGGCAGTKLSQSFGRQGGEPAPRWVAHRWTRLRSLTGLLEGMFTKVRLAEAYPWQDSSEVTYTELVEQPDLDPPWEAGQQKFASRETAGLLELAARWGPDLPNSFQGGPQPEPELRIMPRL